MSVNIDQFSIYSAKILEILYDSFPIPILLTQNSIISEYLTFDQSEELEKLKIKRGLSDIIEMTGDKELTEGIKSQRPAIESQIAELENEQRYDKQHQEMIYKGTLDFLRYEQLLRKLETGKYQLTSKGFSHLNKVFESGEISIDRKSNIAILKSIFKKSSDTSLKIAAGTAVNVISRMLGYD